MAEPLNTNNFYGQVRICEDVASDYKGIVIDHIHDYFNAQQVSNEESAALTFAISGGSSGKICLKSLCSSKEHFLEQTEWLLVDERCVEKTHQDSNYNMISSIIEEYGLNKNSIYPLNCNDANSYESILLRKNLEIIQLGFGPDGHCASLFPNSSALQTRPSQLVVKNSDPSGLNRHPRITMTLEAIKKFKLAIICVIGEEKKDALHAISQGKLLPAAMVKADNVIWLIDEKAI